MECNRIFYGGIRSLLKERPFYLLRIRSALEIRMCLFRSTWSSQEVRTHVSFAMNQIFMRGSCERTAQVVVPYRSSRHRKCRYRWYPDDRWLRWKIGHDWSTDRASASEVSGHRAGSFPHWSGSFANVVNQTESSLHRCRIQRKSSQSISDTMLATPWPIIILLPPPAPLPPKSIRPSARSMPINNVCVAPSLCKLSIRIRSVRYCSIIGGRVETVTGSVTVDAGISTTTINSWWWSTTLMIAARVVRVVRVGLNCSMISADR